MMVRRWRERPAACLAVLVLASCAQPASAPTAPSPSIAASASAAPSVPAQVAGQNVIRLGVPALDLNYRLPVIIGQAEGYFDQENVQVELDLIASPASIPALVNGEIEATGSATAAIAAGLQGASVKAVFFPYSTSTLQFVVDPKKISQPSDLVGQPIATGSPGNAQTLATTLMLKAMGIDPASVQYVALPSDSDQLNAMLGGQVVAATPNPSTAALLKEKGFSVIATSSQVVPIPWSGYATSDAYISQHRDTLEAWMRGMIRSLQFVEAQPDQAADLVAQALQVDQSVAQDSVSVLLQDMNPSDPGGWTEDGMLHQLDFIPAQVKSQAGNTAVDQFSDVTPLREAQRQLGISCAGGYQCS